ncbi:hypothetical protein BC826DRAFT_1077533 [Russula brevipes]|nr:hypothetical protein BC826DRAFT_1077533 [Russula brevipes]
MLCLPLVTTTETTNRVIAPSPKSPPMIASRPALTLIPPEILLYILSFLDVPDLSTLASTCRYLASLAADPILQRTRLLVVAPSRLSHSLFAIGPEGLPLRPTVSDLIRRGVIKGLGIERRWRAGLYLYSALSVANYERSVLLQRGHASNVVSSKLRRWSLHPNPLKTLYKTRVLPDVESYSPLIARSLLPVMRRLKWSVQCDSLSRVLRSRNVTSRRVDTTKQRD